MDKNPEGTDWGFQALESGTKSKNNKLDQGYMNSNRDHLLIKIGGPPEKGHGPESWVK